MDGGGGERERTVDRRVVRRARQYRDPGRSPYCPSNTQTKVKIIMDI